MDGLDLRGKKCPCAPGWSCDDATDTCIEVTGDGDADADADGDADADADADVDADTDADTDSDADADADADGDADADADSDGDSCEGPLEDLELDTDVAGTTDGAFGDLDTPCAVGRGQPNTVYAYTPPDTGILTVQIEPDGWDPVVSFRGECADAGSELGCNDDGVAGQLWPHLVACVPGGDELAVIVDGYGDVGDGREAGAFTLTASFVSEPTCVAEIEPNDAAATAQAIADGTILVGTITEGEENDYYALDLVMGQTATIDLSRDCSADLAIFVYGDPLPNPLPDTFACDGANPAPALACSNQGACESLDFPAPADGTYYVRIVEAGGDDTGSYIMTVTVP